MAIFIKITFAFLFYLTLNPKVYGLIQIPCEQVPGLDWSESAQSSLKAFFDSTLNSCDDLRPKEVSAKQSKENKSKDIQSCQCRIDKTAKGETPIELSGQKLNVVSSALNMIHIQEQATGVVQDLERLGELYNSVGTALDQDSEEIKTLNQCLGTGLKKKLLEDHKCRPGRLDEISKALAKNPNQTKGTKSLNELLLVDVTGPQKKMGETFDDYLFSILYDFASNEEDQFLENMKTFSNNPLFSLIAMGIDGSQKSDSKSKSDSDTIEKLSAYLAILLEDSVGDSDDDSGYGGDESRRFFVLSDLRFKATNAQAYKSFKEKVTKDIQSVFKGIKEMCQSIEAKVVLLCKENEGKKYFGIKTYESAAKYMANGDRNRDWDKEQKMIFYKNLFELGRCLSWYDGDELKRDGDLGDGTKQAMMGKRSSQNAVIDDKLMATSTKDQLEQADQEHQKKNQEIIGQSIQRDFGQRRLNRISQVAQLPYRQRVGQIQSMAKQVAISAPEEVKTGWALQRKHDLASLNKTLDQKKPTQEEHAPDRKREATPLTQEEVTSVKTILNSNQALKEDDFLKVRSVTQNSSTNASQEVLKEILHSFQKRFENNDKKLERVKEKLATQAVQPKRESLERLTKNIADLVNEEEKLKEIVQTIPHNSQMASATSHWAGRGVGRVYSKTQSGSLVGSAGGFTRTSFATSAGSAIGGQSNPATLPQTAGGSSAIVSRNHPSNGVDAVIDKKPTQEKISNPDNDRLTLQSSGNQRRLSFKEILTYEELNQAVNSTDQDESRQEVAVWPNGSDPESLLKDEKNHKILVHIYNKGEPDKRPIYLYTQVVDRSTGTIESSYVDPDMMLKDESTKKPVSYQQLLETIYRYL